jgi:Glyceraldehyde-3-phosphate dehydrogenase/erythrose-4-phosphate dehydrogenase
MAPSINDSPVDNPVSPAACKVGINGFGRIGLWLYIHFPSNIYSTTPWPGRNVLRAALVRSDIQVVAINHTCVTVEDLIYLIRYDSSMGNLDERTDIQAISDNLITINGARIALTSERDLKKLNWATLGVGYVLECTGKFTKRDLAMEHIIYGQAKRVLISAPSSDSPTFVYGVNSDSYNAGEECRVVSNASCTTNCVTPVLKVLHDTFGITQGFLTTIHAATRSQQVLDGYSKKNRRLGKRFPIIKLMIYC